MFWKNGVKNISGWIFFKFCRILLKNRITIFNFHEVANHESDFQKEFNLNIKPLIFEFQLKFIKRNFNIISPKDLLNNNIPENAALITFDDGFKGVYENAIPLLEKYNTPAIVFLNMCVIKGEIFWAGLITYLCKNDNNFVIFLKNELKINNFKLNDLFLYCNKNIVNTYLDKNYFNLDEKVKMYVGDFINITQLNDISNCSQIYFGNHLDNHYVAKNMSENDLLESYLKNKLLLNSYKNHIDFFAFPFGQSGSSFNNSQVELIYNAGAKKIFSTDMLLNNNKNKFLHRIPLFNSDNKDNLIWFRIFSRNFKIFKWNY